MRKLFITISIFLLCFLGATAYADDFQSSITVKGEGSVLVEPDLATVSFAITAENEDASAVQKL